MNEDNEPIGWTRKPCGSCRGYGLVSDYGNGEDFYGAKECDDCCGGTYWRHDSTGTLAEWPGGRLLGREGVTA